ncbi:MAG: hypothetical protein HeimC2_36000 [Candidatus Heimdallarchaeota archaeon LC_2]|nr:MAG: hypothetical protein HeimC2_36000 [Candidatus Heimdallarchaeota archaeon LC_2]
MVDRYFPNKIYSEIININSVLKNNPLAPVKGSQEFIDAVAKWNKQALIGNAKAGTNLIRVKISEIDGLGEFLASILIPPEALDSLNRGLWSLLNRANDRLFRYMDTASWEALMKLRDKLIRMEGNLPAKDDAWNTFKSIIYWFEPI